MLTITQVCLALCLGVCFITLELEKVYWHIPINPRYRHFLTVQVGATVRQFRVLVFSLNTEPRVVTMLMKPMARALSHLRVESEVSRQLPGPSPRSSPVQSSPPACSVSGTPEGVTDQSCHCLAQDRMGFSASYLPSISRKLPESAVKGVPCHVHSKHLLS